jgi:hypothetical protein
MPRPRPYESALRWSGCADQRHKKRSFLRNWASKRVSRKTKEASGNGDTSQMVTRIEEDWKVQTGAAQLLKNLDDNLARPPNFLHRAI